MSMFKMAEIGEGYLEVIDPSDFKMVAEMLLRQDYNRCPVVEQILSYMRKHGSTNKLEGGSFMEFVTGPFGGSSENRSILSDFSFNYSGGGGASRSRNEEISFDF